MLLLVAMRERKMRIEVGYGLEGVLTDVKSACIIREVMKPLFARGEVAEGIDRGLDAIMAMIEPAGPAPKAAPELSPDDVKLEPGAKIIAAVLGLVVLLVSTMSGIVGLPTSGVLVIGMVCFCYPDWRGWLFAGAYVTAWSAVRWLTIRGNVEKYHLKESNNKTLTWLRCFVAAGLAGPQKKPQPRPAASRKVSALADEGSSFSFADSADSSGDSSSSDTASSDTSSSDCGGASGGGVASDDW